MHSTRRCAEHTIEREEVIHGVDSMRLAQHSYLSAILPLRPHP